MFEEISENEISEKKKRRKAAEKAWQTIRKKKRKKMAESSETLLKPGIVKLSEPSLMAVRTKTGRQIIHQFNKTPPNIACGPFWELRWAFGCPFDCAYCYLRGTMRGRMQPRYINIKHVLEALDYTFVQNQFNDGKPAVFNSGELADSWMKPENMIKIVDKFEEQDKHKILTLTKFGTSNPMLKMLTKQFHKQIITAFSINATKVAELYETKAPQPMSRIEAATQLSDYGYDVRVRIDPIFPIDDWREHYQDVVYSILSKFEPKRVILGTPRGLRKTIVFGRKAGVDLSWVEFLERKETGWGWKLPFKTRMEIYQFLYEKLLALGFPKDRISICKETLEMWEELKLNYEPLSCNCYGRG